MNHSDLIKHVHYDPETGIFTALKSRGNLKRGSVIGTKSSNGYLKARVLGKYVKLHRLAWFYVNKKWPDYEIDHLNRVRDDNRICNLRDVCGSVNCANQSGPRTNNTTGFRGVHRIEKTGRFRVRCTIGGVRQDLGSFETAAAAGAAYISFRRSHGYVN